MKARTEQEQQDRLFRIVNSKWRRMVVRIRAVKKITDECFLVAIATNRKLCPMLRAMAQVAVKDKDLVSSIRLINEITLKRSFLIHRKRMKEEWFYRFRKNMEGKVVTVQCYWNKVVHGIDGESE